MPANDTNRKLQRALISRGFDLGASGDDGFIGTKTKAAIVSFKASVGLAPADSSVSQSLIDSLLGGSTDAGFSVADYEPWTAEILRRVGLNETQDNIALRRFLASDGETVGDPAHIPWCGDLVQTAFALTLENEPLPANPYYALNWSKFGVAIPDGTNQHGAVVTYKRFDPHGNVIGGHVGILVGHDKFFDHVLAGNQSNKICIAKISKQRRVAQRWPSTYKLILRNMAETELAATISNNEA
jgi:hypothetical protein